MSNIISVDENKLYYFTVFRDDRYYTVFPGWIRRVLIQAFRSAEPGESYVAMKMNAGEHTFISDIGKPLYLLPYDNQEVSRFGRDFEDFEFFPSGNIPEDLEYDPVIRFPSYFTADVKPLIEFRLFNTFQAQQNGVWVPLEI